MRKLEPINVRRVLSSFIYRFDRFFHINKSNYAGYFDSKEDNYFFHLKFVSILLTLILILALHGDVIALGVGASGECEEYCGCLDSAYRLTMEWEEGIWNQDDSYSGSLVVDLTVTDWKDPDDQTEPMEVYWSTDPETLIDCVVVQAGTNTWASISSCNGDDPASAGTVISDTKQQPSGQIPAISHISFCFDEDVSEEVVDLELMKTVEPTSPVAVGSDVTFTITLENNQANAEVKATGVTVEDILPSGLTYKSHNAYKGSYTLNNGGGEWEVGELAIGEVATLDITASIDPELADNYPNVAEVVSCDQADYDSTPDNGDPNEDDQDSATVKSYKVTNNLNGLTITQEFLETDPNPSALQSIGSFGVTVNGTSDYTVFANYVVNNCDFSQKAIWVDFPDGGGAYLSDNSEVANYTTLEGMGEDGETVIYPTYIDLSRVGSRSSGDSCIITIQIMVSV